MRRIEFSVSADIPSRRVGWAQLGDAIASQWSMANRKQFLGSVAIGYVWKTAKDPRWSRHGRTWWHLACIVKPIVGGVPCVGPCRWVPVEQQEANLRLTIEEDA